jgi:hypothetical protein
MQQMQQQLDQLLSQGRLEAAESTNALAADVITRTGVCRARGECRQSTPAQLMCYCLCDVCIEGIVRQSAVQCCAMRDSHGH